VVNAVKRKHYQSLFCGACCKLRAPHYRKRCLATSQSYIQCTAVHIDIWCIAALYNLFFCFVLSRPWGYWHCIFVISARILTSYFFIIFEWTKKLAGHGRSCLLPYPFLQQNRQTKTTDILYREAQRCSWGITFILKSWLFSLTSDFVLISFDYLNGNAVKRKHCRACQIRAGSGLLSTDYTDFRRLLFAENQHIVFSQIENQC